MENYNERASGKGTLAVLLGIVGIVCFFWKAIVSIIIGIIVLILGVKGKNESPKGKKAMSIFGIFLGIVDLLLPLVVVAFFYFKVWPSAVSDLELRTYCVIATCDSNNKNCTYVDNEGKTVSNVDCSKVLGN